MFQDCRQVPHWVSSVLAKSHILTSEASFQHAHLLAAAADVSMDATDLHAHSSRETSVSISLTEAMNDAPEPSPRKISFHDKPNFPASNGHSKRASLYASQDPISAVPQSPSLYSARYSSLSPEMAERPRTMSPMGRPGSAETFRSPFGYQTQIYPAGKPSLKSSSEIGKRRGHRYKSTLR